MLPAEDQPRSFLTNWSAIVAAFIFGCTLVYGAGQFTSKSDANTVSNGAHFEDLEMRVQKLDDRDAKIESREASVETSLQFIRESLNRIEDTLNVPKK